MTVISLLMNIVALLTRALIWLILLPFLLCYWAVKVWWIRAKFKSQLLQAGIRRDVADRLARRYNVSLWDILRLARTSADRA